MKIYFEEEYQFEEPNLGDDDASRGTWHMNILEDPRIKAYIELNLASNKITAYEFDYNNDSFKLYPLL